MKSFLILLLLASVSACGVKGPPLPPAVALTPQQSDQEPHAAPTPTPTPTQKKK